MDPRKVAVQDIGAGSYPSSPPFNPSRAYPEYVYGSTATEENLVYEGVRAVFRLWGLDDKRFGTPDWNPLGEFLRPGERVLIKPNFIKESHPRDPDGWKYTVTHGSIIRAVADYIWKALDGRG